MAVIISSLFINCSNNVNQLTFMKGDSSSFKVNKIDSINNYYLIYLIKQGKKYKIVSKKNSGEFNNCKNFLKEDGYYNFELENLIPEVQSSNPLENRIPYPALSCYLFDGNTKICEENEMETLYKAKNLKGLCVER